MRYGAALAADHQVIVDRNAQRPGHGFDLARHLSMSSRDGHRLEPAACLRGPTDIETMMEGLRLIRLSE
jgi:hypothetical protein